MNARLDPIFLLHQGTKKARQSETFPASDFHFDPKAMTCDCPVGNGLSLRHVKEVASGTPTAYFEGKLFQCRTCPYKSQCMHNPAGADHRKGNRRQVSFTIEHRREPTHTDWMKQRVDSEQGKQIYGHRMSVVEPVFANIGTNLS